MVYNSFDQLIHAVRKNAGGKKRVAVAAAEDEHALEAVLHAQRENIVSPVLVGNEKKIRAVAEKLGESLDGCGIADVPEGEDPAQAAVEQIKLGRADFIMKGKIETANLLKRVVEKESGLRTGRPMSHLAFFELPSYHKLLIVTDGGIITYPDLEQKRQIIINAANTLRGMGYTLPKAAVLAAAEQVNPKIQETVDAGKLKKMNLSGEITGCVVEGPISFDLAVSKESARIKGFDCPYSGDFDVMVVPNLSVGNILGKAFVYMGGAKMAGLVVGAKIPIVLTSRGASAEEKYLSLALAACVQNE